MGIGMAGHGRVMGDHHQRAAAVSAQRREEVGHRLRRFDIEIPGRLVGQDQVGIVGNSACDGHALALASRKLVRAMAQAGSQTHITKELGGPVAPDEEDTPFKVSANSTFSTAVKASSRPKCWKTKPTVFRR